MIFEIKDRMIDNKLLEDHKKKAIEAAKKIEDKKHSKNNNQKIRITLKPKNNFMDP